MADEQKIVEVVTEEDKVSEDRQLIVSSYKSNGETEHKRPESSEVESNSIGAIKNLSRITLNSSQVAGNDKIEDFVTDAKSGGLHMVMSNRSNLHTFGNSVVNLGKIESFDNFDVKGQEESYKEMHEIIVKES